jgi:hypothetical protein
MHIPPKVDGVRRYTHFTGCKVPGRERSCIVEVCTGRVTTQCSRPRGHGLGGLFCQQHSKMTEKEGWSPDDTL